MIPLFKSRIEYHMCARVQHSTWHIMGTQWVSVEWMRPLAAIVANRVQMLIPSNDLETKAKNIGIPLLWLPLPQDSSWTWNSHYILYASFSRSLIKNYELKN